MKFLLVHTNAEYRTFIPPQLVSLEGYLKAHNHSVEVFDASFYREAVLQFNENQYEGAQYFELDYEKIGVKIKNESLVDDFLNFVETVSPDVIGFSVYSMQKSIPDLLAAAAKKKYPGIFIMYGGYYPTITPEKAIAHAWVDLICVGEGEAALRDLGDRFDRNEDLTTIQNIWFKENGQIHKNPLRPFIDLDTLPLPNWESYASYQQWGPIEGKLFKLGLVYFSRGCPNHCSYCSNSKQMELYRKSGIQRYIRHKSVERFIEECKYLVATYGVEFFYFIDGTFLCMPKQVFEKLATVYAREVGIPFLCLTTAPSISEWSAQLLKRMNCFQVNIGVECADPKYRKNVLKRPTMTNDQIINAVHTLRKNGIRTNTYNMIIPGQSRKEISDTIDLNRACAPDKAMASLYIPFEGMELTEYLKQNGYSTSNDAFNDAGNILNMSMNSDLSDEEAEEIKIYFSLYCNIPDSERNYLHQYINDNTPEGMRKFQLLKEKYLPKSPW